MRLFSQLSAKTCFEYPQHVFWLRNKKINFQVHSYLEACYELAQFWTHQIQIRRSNSKLLPYFLSKDILWVLTEIS